MATKTTGAEFKKFYGDAEFWPEGRWHEDDYIEVDGVHDADADLMTISDSAVVSMSGGYVINADDSDGGSFISLFKKWQKQQTFRSFVVDVPKDRADELAAAVKAMGGKVAA